MGFPILRAVALTSLATGMVLAMALELTHILFHRDEPTDGEDEFVEAAPEGDPAGVAVAFAHQEATESGEVSKEVADGGQLSLPQRAEHFQPEFRDHAFGGKVGVSGRNRLELQPAHGQHAGEARDRFESMGVQVLPRLESQPVLIAF